jgi:hypothetical protein
MAEITQTVDEIPDDAYLTVSRTAAHYLRETSKWAYFLSILGFVLTGLIVVIGIFAGSFMSTMMQQSQANAMPQGMSSFFSIFYVLMGLLYFFPSWYLFKYSQKLKLAISSKDSNELVAAFENQKSLYKFWGIFAIVMMSIYAIVLAFAFMASAFR